MDIKGYEGLYQVSDYGRVRRLHKDIRSKPFKVLKSIKLDNGYLRIILCKKSKIKQYYIHRLVLETFVGPCPPRMECRHLDGDPQNNKLENLCWGTRKENMKDRISHGTSSTHSDGFTINNRDKLNKKSIIEIRELIKRGWADIEIGYIYKVHHNTIADIRLNRTWRWVQ